MRWPRFAISLTAAAMASAVTACKNPFEIFPPKVPRGSVELRVEQTGSDQTLHTFTAMVDGADYGPITSSGSVTVEGLDPEREHGATLGEVPPNCTITEGAVQIFRVQEDQTTALLFHVDCGS